MTTTLRLSKTCFPLVGRRLVGAPTVAMAPTPPRLALIDPYSRLPGRVSLGHRHSSFKRNYSKDTTSSNTPVSTSTSTEGAKSKISKFKKYAEQFKDKPASHLISFGILHEITAVVPLPIVYFALAETGVKIPFPDQAIEEGNKFVQRVVKYYGWNLEGADGGRVMLNMATSYAVVKVITTMAMICVDYQCAYIWQCGELTDLFTRLHHVRH